MSGIIGMYVYDFEILIKQFGEDEAMLFYGAIAKDSELLLRNLLGKKILTWTTGTNNCPSWSTQDLKWNHINEELCLKYKKMRDYLSDCQIDFWFIGEV